jgi:hypothetical protein
MVDAHWGLGTLVLLAYIAVTVVNVLQIKGRSFSWSKQLSFGAAGLLLLQYVIGFSLLGGDHSITPLHYLFALAALVPVGVEHGLAASQENASKRARIAAAAAAGTTVLVLLAYGIAEAS